MKYRETGEYQEIAERSELVRFSQGYPIEHFDCGVQDYNDFLVHEAWHYEEMGVSSVHLLVEKDTDDVIGYMAILTDSIMLDKTEKARTGLDIPFSSVPALKIGKLATSKSHKEYPYGSFLLQASVALADEMEDHGIGCRFLTVDADTAFNSDTPSFYLKNGFQINEHRQYQHRSSISMRYDLHE